MRVDDVAGNIWSSLPRPEQRLHLGAHAPRRVSSQAVADVPRVQPGAVGGGARDELRGELRGKGVAAEVRGRDTRDIEDG